jgi:hypothetical protein
MKPKRISEVSAKGVRGYLLYSPIGDRYFFRVHNKDNPAEFEDYKITAEDIHIELLSDFNRLVKYDNGDQRLDYSSDVLRIK